MPCTASVVSSSKTPHGAVCFLGVALAVLVLTATPPHLCRTPSYFTCTPHPRRCCPVVETWCRRCVPSLQGVKARTHLQPQPPPPLALLGGPGLHQEQQRKVVAPSRSSTRQLAARVLWLRQVLWRLLPLLLLLLGPWLPLPPAGARWWRGRPATWMTWCWPSMATWPQGTAGEEGAAPQQQQQQWKGLPCVRGMPLQQVWAPSLTARWAAPRCHCHWQPG